jgi:hypothetical protein
MPRKVFTAGEVLSASNVNSFLMNQTVMTFDGSAARSSAIGTATEGMVTWLNDSNSLEVFDGTQWIGLAASAGNLIINGGMDIAQRGTSFTFASGAGGKFYGADRFFSIDFSWSSGSNITVANDTSVFPSNIGVSSSYRVSTGATGLTFNSGGIQYIKTFIEGADAESLYGRTATLSFYVRSSVAGVYSLFLENGNWETGTTTRAFSPTYTINAANTWERKTIVLDMASAVSAGTWNTTNGIGLGISWMLGANANRTGSSYNSGWATYSASTPQSNLGTQFMTGANRNFYLTGVQLEVGPTANAFRRNANSIEGELAACQRYYYRITATATADLLAWGAAYNTNTARFSVPFPVPMRIKPTAVEQSGIAGDYQISVSGVGNITCTGAPSFSAAAFNLATINASVTSPMTTYHPVALNSLATNAYLGWSAEL